MEVYKTPSKEIQEIILANVTYEAVIDGLNGYFTSEPRNNYISIWPTVNKRDFVLYEPEAWADILIEWLRKKHDIFYRPGMTLDQVESARSAAKMCCLRAHIKDEICKRGLWFGADEDIPELVDTLFKVIDECRECVDKNRKDAAKLSKENGELRKEVKDIMNDIRQESSRNGFEFPEEIDGEPLTVKRVFHDLLELLRMKETRIRNAERETRKAVSEECYVYLWNALKKLSPDCDALKITDYEDLVDRIFYEMSLVNDNCKKCRRKQSTDKFSYIQRTNKAEEEVKKLKEQLDKAAADYQALGEESDINTLIRDYCTKNNIVAPSRYFSEKACVEYLFSVIDLKQKDRSFTILQDLYRDIFKRQPDGLSAEDIANKILDRVLKTEDLLHKSVDSVNKECKAVGKQMVDDYEKDLLQFICKEYKNRIRLNDNFILYDPPSVRNTVLKIISDYARCRTRVDILETRIKSIFDRCKANFTVDDYVLNGDPTTSFVLDCISSWISSPAESRGKTRAEIKNYKLKLKDYILKDIKEHGYRYDGLEKKSIEDIVDWIITMATCANKEVEDAKKEAKQECYLYLWNALKELSPECDALKIDCYENLVDRIFYEMSLINGNCKRCQRKHSTEKFDYIRRANKAEEEVKKLNDVIKKQKELLNEINKEEENEWFKP